MISKLFWIQTQKLFEGGFVKHASDSTAQKLVEGFVIFYFTPKSCWREKTEGKFNLATFWWLIKTSN